MLVLLCTLICPLSTLTNLVIWYHLCEYNKLTNKAHIILCTWWNLTKGKYKLIQTKLINKITPCYQIPFNVPKVSPMTHVPVMLKCSNFRFSMPQHEMEWSVPIFVANLPSQLLENSENCLVLVLMRLGRPRAIINSALAGDWTQITFLVDHPLCHLGSNIYSFN